MACSQTSDTDLPRRLLNYLDVTLQPTDASISQRKFLLPICCNERRPNILLRNYGPVATLGLPRPPGILKVLCSSLFEPVALRVRRLSTLPSPSLPADLRWPPSGKPLHALLHLASMQTVEAIEAVDRGRGKAGSGGVGASGQ